MTSFCSIPRKPTPAEPEPHDYSGHTREEQEDARRLGDRGGRQGAASGDKPDLPTMRLGLPAYPAQRHRVEPANGTATNDESGDDLHRVVAMPATYAIRLEVLAIDGEDFPRAQRFSGGNKRCVRQVHRVISV